jgi:hypothetical protein
MIVSVLSIRSISRVSALLPGHPALLVTDDPADAVVGVDEQVAHIELGRTFVAVERDGAGVHRVPIVSQLMSYEVQLSRSSGLLTVYPFTDYGAAPEAA